MRITTKITSWGKSWFPSFPKIDLDSCYPKDENGEDVFDEANFRQQVRVNPLIQMASNDCGAPCAFGAILIQSVNDWLNDNNEEETDEHSKKIRARINRRIENGNYSYCRIDITGVIIEWQKKLVRGVKVNIITKQNDAFESHLYEHDFAMIVADFCRCYSNKYVNRGDPPLVFTESTQKFIDDLRELTEEGERLEDNRNRVNCPNYHCGQCSPCKFDCKHYADGGKFVEI